MSHFLSNPRLHDAQKLCCIFMGSFHLDKSWGHLNMFHLKSNSWNLSDNYSPTPILNRMRSPGHPTPMPRAPLFARSLSAFRPGNLVNFAFKKLKVQHKRFQIVSNPRRHRSNNPFSKARKTSELRTRIDESKPWLLAQPLWPWTPKRNVPSHYTGKIWNEDTSMVTLPKKGTGWIHAILFGQVRRSNG